MFGKRSSQDAASKAEGAFDPVRQDNVAVPEVCTGKVDVPGDFEREQHTDSKSNVVFDTVAVPEFHTGKCPSIDTSQEKKRKNGLLRTIVDGSTEE